MTLPVALLSAVGIWILLIIVIGLVVLPRLRHGPSGDPVTVLLWYATRAISRFLHHTTYTGTERLPRNDHHGGLVIVSNHTGAVDPILIQAACPFLVRWMMAQDMMVPSLDLLWRHQRLISVDRDGSDSASLRTAIRHVKDGGAVGIFPEGRIVRPSHQVWPFHPGVGLVVARTKAPVLLCWVTGTPNVEGLAASVVTPSQARVSFIDVIRYDDEKRAERIATDLRERIAAATGWPMVDDVPPRPASALDPFAI